MPQRMVGGVVDMVDGGRRLAEWDVPVVYMYRGEIKAEMNIRGSLEDDYLDIINPILATSRRAHSSGE